MTTFDLAPACATTRDVVLAIRDDQLTGPTPCPDYTVGDLLEHVGGLAVAFRESAGKRPMSGEMRDGDAAHLGEGWRERIAADLDALAVAWADPAAWEGETHAGPLTFPAPVAASVAIDEVVVHGWDLAVSTGQPYDPDPAAIAVCHEFVSAFDAPANDDGGLFGPPVDVGADATPSERLVALTGRDPAWRP